MPLPIAILTADFHIPASINYSPVCRTDNYWETFKKKITFIKKLQTQYNIPVIDAGDMCNTWRLEPQIEAWCIENLPNSIYTVPGNHELPNKNINYIKKSSLYVLSVAKKVHIIQDIIKLTNGLTICGYPYGAKIKSPGTPVTIGVCHIMVCDTPPKSSKISYVSAKALLKKMHWCDVIVTGHNHKSFSVSEKNRVLINPGSLMRSSIDQITHKPTIYLLYPDNKIRAIKIPIKKITMPTKHIEKNNQVDAFIEKLEMDGYEEISFIKNMNNFLKINKIKPSIHNIIMDSMK